jgi:hypothetical protein
VAIVLGYDAAVLAGPATVRTVRLDLAIGEFQTVGTRQFAGGLETRGVDNRRRLLTCAVNTDCGIRARTRLLKK